jgi:hypothetical protein
MLGPLANLGRSVFDQTVGIVLKRHGIARPHSTSTQHATLQGKLREFDVSGCTILNI